MDRKITRFLSLKWKALYLTSALFVILTGVYLLSGKAYIDRQFQHKREIANLQYRNELTVLVERSAQQLHQLASTISSLDGMSIAMLRDDPIELQQAFDRHWWKFEIEGGIDSAAFFSAGGNLLARWGPEVREQGLVDRVSKTVQPQWMVSCDQSCQILAALPVLIDGKFSTITVLSISFIDVILNFNSITSADIGLLVGSNQTQTDSKHSKFYWQKKLIALTNAKQNIPLLDTFITSHVTMPEVSTRNLLTADGKTYEFSLQPITWPQSGSESQVLVVSNVTNDIESARRIFRNTLIGAIFGLIASELILLAILWKPTTQLQRVVDALPLLAENNFEQARANFRNTDQQAMLTDESDILKSTALNLSYQLEALHSLLNNRAIQLEARGVELETEKNFVLGLLNTAHALILTQDGNGEIVMINHHGEKLVGMNNTQIVGSQFSQLLAKQDDVNDVRHKLRALFDGEIEDLHHESMAVNHEGDPRYMSWFHSRLPDRGDGDHHILTVAIDISERRVAEENLGWLASHDTLTGLLNRRRFEDELKHIMAASHRYQHSGALLFIDLDQFKDVNDSSGHQVGDVMLKRVAETLQDTARESDVVARLGGDEFAVVLLEADEITAGETAERFCKALIKIAVPGTNRIHRISCSIGVALFPTHGMEPTEILANADIAMYLAKEAGRNTWAIFNEDESGKERIHERVYWNERVKYILFEESFDIYFQPILSLSDGEVSHYEALLRVPGEDVEMMAPEKFIAAAERGGLVQIMDEKVIDKVLAYQMELQCAGRAAKVSINLSGLSFRNANLVDHIRRCVEKYQVDPSQIVFEITETAAVADIAMAINVMQDIRDIGCQFALDDFGVGFSSLHYLKRLPVDYIKIDGSFITELHKERVDQVFVKALVNIASECKQRTVAEFVDSPEVFAMVRELGVDYAQGYYIARPEPFNKVWIEEEKTPRQA